MVLPSSNIKPCLRVTGERGGLRKPRASIMPRMNGWGDMPTKCAKNS